MTVEYHTHDIRCLSCDSCGENGGEFDSDDFHEMVEAAKADGWLIRKDSDDQWEHYCPECREEVESDDFDDLGDE